MTSAWFYPAGVISTIHCKREVRVIDQLLRKEIKTQGDSGNKEVKPV